MTTDTTEKGLEDLIVGAMSGRTVKKASDGSCGLQEGRNAEMDLQPYRIHR